VSFRKKQAVVQYEPGQGQGEGDDRSYHKSRLFGEPPSIGERQSDVTETRDDLHRFGLTVL
jgi:hypothetical protein